MADPIYTFGVQAGQEVSPMDSEKHLLVEIIASLQGPSGGPAGLTDAQLRATPVPVSSTPASGTLSIFAKTAGQTENIPVGAFNIGIIFLTGTGTVNGVDLPVNVPLNIDARTAAVIVVACGSPGTARISYLL